MSRIRFRPGGAASAMSRRAFMGLVGAGALALPFVRLLGARAQAAPEHRLLIFFSPNGSIGDQWTPDGGETDFQLRRILAPLDSHRDRLLILSGLDMKMGGGPGDGHQRGMGGMLTGRELLPGDTAGDCESCPGVSWASGISIDQYIANAIGDDTPFRSVELGLQTGGQDIWTRMSYRGAGDPMPPDDNPYSAFGRLFAGVQSGDGEPDPAVLRRLAMNQSVLDAVKDDFAALSAELVGDDRARLDAHLTMVRDIERRLTAAPTEAVSCVVPDLGPMLDLKADDNYPLLGQLQLDMLVAALSCNLTNVGSMQFNKSVGGQKMPWLGIDEGHHAISHAADSDAAATEQLIEINAWYAKQFARLLDSLSASPEADGDMLDHTLVYWCNELGKGNDHSRNDLPALLAGNLDGHFRTGRHLVQNASHTDLFVSMANAFGIETNTFGDPEHCNGPLPNLT